VNEAGLAGGYEGRPVAAKELASGYEGRPVAAEELASGCEGRPVAAEELASGYEAVRSRLAAIVIGRETLRVAGPDAERYLQGQLSQDIARLPQGGWAWSLVLQPQGKLDALVRCYRAAAEEFLLVTDAGAGPPLLERLLRFRLRTKADIEKLDWRAVAVLGPGAAEAVLGGEGLPAGAEVAVPFEWGGLSGVDLLGPSPSPPPGALPVSEEAYEAARVEAGLPRHGAELDERTIPAEAGLVAAAVSFTKGCYTGQELVARIDSRGSNVPRHLRGLLLSGPAEAGAVLYVAAPGGEGEGRGGAAEALKQVGRLTSLALSPRLGWVGLGYVGRGVDVGARLVVGKPLGRVTAQVSELPLASR
jgi:folate-binding protein YgfZ